LVPPHSFTNDEVNYKIQKWHGKQLPGHRGSNGRGTKGV
jgi:hypothetical protein